MTRDTISKFNRDTVWLATGVLGTVVFAALVIAFQEGQSKATQAQRDFLLNANPATGAGVVARSANSNRTITPGPGSSIDHAFTETSLQQILSSKTGPAASTPALALKSAIGNDAQANPGSRTLAPRQDSVPVIRQKIRNIVYRSSMVHTSVDVKRRLIELWHRSLARSEKSRNWTAFSNLNTGASKKAAYTAETNH